MHVFQHSSARDVFSFLPDLLTFFNSAVQHCTMSCCLSRNDVFRKAVLSLKLEAMNHFLLHGQHLATMGFPKS
jgi:hypothetical protein